MWLQRCCVCDNTTKASPSFETAQQSRIENTGDQIGRLSSGRWKDNGEQSCQINI